MYHATPTDERIAPLLAAAGIETRKTVTLHAADSVTISGTYYDGGSRSEYVAVGADGLTCTRLYGRQPFDGRGREGDPEVKLLPADSSEALPAFVVVAGTFCGKAAAVSVYVHPSRLAPLLPETVELGEAERSLLGAISTFNSKGRKDWRERNEITREQWDELVKQLAARALLTPRGAITAEGRNAISGVRFDEYKATTLG